ncbi:GDSL-type esterase/lipase family protein [Neorhodopirellula pilleata]|nr:GDSL-type esterase/lipase family protein [Neorhodopirellula pilleata]
MTVLCHAQDQIDTSQSTFLIPATDEGLPGAGPIRRYEWMQNVWSQRRATFARRAEQDHGAVVFLGDSITQGWKDDFAGDFAGMKVANRGISGDTTRGMLIRLQEDVLSLDPAAVVLLMGTNDLEELAEPATIAGNVQLILDSLKKHNPAMPVVLCQVMPSSASKKRSAESIQQLNELLVDMVSGDRQVTMVDTWTLFADANGDAIAAEFPDLLHPNRAGYEKWRDALIPLFETLGLLEPEVTSLTIEPGFVALHNGKDLTGWELRPTPEPMRKSRERWLSRNPKGIHWPLVEEKLVLDGKTQTPNERFVARHGRIIVTTPPDGRSIEQLWTSKDFSGDLTLRLQFRATPNADSGVFLRGPQLQCRDFKLAGPYKELIKYRPQKWNDLEIVVKDDVARCTCNGEVLEEALAIPADGPIGLEGDRGQIEYRHIRIKQ